MNGTEINYIDNLNEPQSITAPYTSWSQAREWFERKVSHTLIISHKTLKL